MKNKNLISLEDLINKEYGPVGTAARDKFEAGYNDFKLGVMPREQLAPKARQYQRKHFKN